MTLLEEFAQLMELLNLGTYKEDGSRGGDIFLARLPSTPDVAVAVAMYGGTESSLADTYDEPSIQVRVRGPATDARAPEQRAQQIYQALHGLGELVMPGGTWLQLMVGKQGGPIFIGQDANSRPEYTINFRAEVSRTT